MWIRSWIKDLKQLFEKHGAVLDSVVFLLHIQIIDLCETRNVRMASSFSCMTDLRALCSDRNLVDAISAPGHTLKEDKSRPNYVAIDRRKNKRWNTNNDH